MIAKKPLVPSTPSGSHPAVQYARKKLDSIADNEIAEFKRLNERLAKVTTTPPKDARREPEDDPRAEPGDHVDDVGPVSVTLHIESDPFPEPHEDNNDE